MKLPLKSFGIVIFCFFSFVSFTQAQQKEIRGTVTDPNGELLTGVNVLVKGTNQGAVTNANGQYEIKINKDAVLIFSMLGFQPTEAETKDYDDNIIDVSLKSKVEGLEKLVVVGYSKVRQEHIASAVSEVDMDKVKTKSITKMEQAFRGTVPGVTMLQTSNVPGDVPGSIRIRGESTLQNSDPLVLVDGIEQSIHDINPDDIENITVLKDAASTSMYGSRGANGVILITTKRGVADKFKVDLRSSVSVYNPIKLPDFVNSADYMKLQNEAYQIQDGSTPYSSTDIQKAEDGLIGTTDWEDVIMRSTAFSNRTSAAISGGGGVGTFNLMLGYLNNQGLNKLQGQEKYSARFNTNINVADKFVLLADFYARRLDVDKMHRDNGNSLFAAAWRRKPTDSVFHDNDKGIDRSEHYWLHNDENPLASIDKGGVENSLYDRITLNLRPQYNINKELSIHGDVSYMINKSATKYERRTFIFYDAKGQPKDIWANSVGSSQGTSQSQLTARALLNYDRQLRNNKDYLYVTAGSEIMSTNFTNYIEYSKTSFFGKINYSFENRYNLEVTMREDGSSKFAPGHRWGFFPAGAIAWNVENERFMQSLKDRGVIDNLKIRLSYGLIGNENVDPYLWEENVNNWGWTERVPNPEFSWEKQTQFNVGLDFSALHNRLSLTFDAYNKHSYDLIFSSYPVPPLTGSSNLESSVNIGSVENKGWELSMGWRDQIGDFSYSITGMVFNNRNRVLKAGYTNSDTLIFKGNSEKIWYKGISLNNYYGYESDGYFQSESDLDHTEAKLPGSKRGDVKYVDQNGDGIINEKDRTNLGNPDPHFNYAFDVSLGYKRWDFLLSGLGVGKRLGRLNGLEGYPVLMDGSSNSYGKPRYYYMRNRWTPDGQNPDSRFPRVWVGNSPNAELSDVWLSNAAFLRISTLQLGYTIPKVSNTFKNLRVYLSADDPFVFTNWEGLDPERDGGNGSYPRMRAFTAGVKVTIQ